MKTFRNKINLPNRYSFENALYLTRVEESGTIASYTLGVDSRSNFVRTGYDPDTAKLDFIDPEGGPFIQVGSSIGRFEVKEIKVVDREYVVRLGV